MLRQGSICSATLWFRVGGRALTYLSLLAGIVAFSGCVRPDPEVTVVTRGSSSATDFGTEPLGGLAGGYPSAPPGVPPTPPVYPSPTTILPSYSGTPTPNSTRSLAGDDGGTYLSHSVAYGETLTYLAKLYNTSVEELMTINGFSNGDVLSVGQVVLVPGASAELGPSFKIIPDSELVYGPGARGFDVRAQAASLGGFLDRYQEEVEGQDLSGPEVVQLIADRFSVNPRLLLAIIEHRSGWVTQPPAGDQEYPLGYVRSGYEGLYRQLERAANLLNLGYYGRAEGGIQIFELTADKQVAFAPDINDGTAAIQLYFASAQEVSEAEWLQDVGPSGFFATYSRLFGNPFAYTVDPLWPSDPAQPALSLPWSPAETWYFTGGPHGAWASGSAWAALDFAPEHEELGCYVSNDWVRAMSDGVVSRSGFGAVVVDLDGDGYAGTGWAITYMHLESRDRVALGMQVKAGDPLGHPSCEGGYSDGTHVHVARSLNGRWVSADGPIPFVMDGWVSQGLGREYDGLLVRGDVVKEACACREEENAIGP
ncbi:MAG: LysM peptidoglycan-binding domain-containing protein [Candidatus Promineifilaceae bacterium]